MVITERELVRALTAAAGGPEARWTELAALVDGGGGRSGDGGAGRSGDGGGRSDGGGGRGGGATAGAVRAARRDPARVPGLAAALARRAAAEPEFAARLRTWATAVRPGPADAEPADAVPADSAPVDAAPAAATPATAPAAAVPASAPGSTANTLTGAYTVGPVVQARDIHGDVRLTVPPPPAPARPPVPHQLLPVPVHFTGRRADVAALDRLRPARLVVLTGSAGIGKTALATRWLDGLRGDHPDGQLHADLGGHGPAGPSRPGDVLSRFLRALGVDQQPRDLTEQATLWRSAVAELRLSVLLDDAVSAGQVRTLLPAAPGVLVVVTSRRRLTGLGVAGAVHHRLDALDPDAALELLSRRAGPDRVAREADAARQVAHACAGLPLAVCVAGARLASRPGLPIAAVADALRPEDGRLAELRAGPPDGGAGWPGGAPHTPEQAADRPQPPADAPQLPVDAPQLRVDAPHPPPDPPRPAVDTPEPVTAAPGTGPGEPGPAEPDGARRTRADGDGAAAAPGGAEDGVAVGAVLDGSYAALPDGAARAYRMLGVLPFTAFDGWTAAAACGLSPEDARPLLDELVEWNLLDDLAPIAAASPSAAAAARYRVHDLVHAHAHRTALHHEPADVRSDALRRAVDLHLATMTAAEALVTPAHRRLRRDYRFPPRVAPRFATERAALEWLAAARPALPALIRAAADRGWDAAVWQLADAAWPGFLRLRPYETWIEADRLGLAAARRLGDRRAESRMLTDGGAGLRNAGRLDEAGAWFREARDAARRDGDRRAEAQATHGMGRVRQLAGRGDEAEPVFLRALRLREEIGHRRGAALTRVCLGEIALERDRPGEAAALFARARAELLAEHDRYDAARALAFLGLSRAASGRTTAGGGADRGAGADGGCRTGAGPDGDGAGGDELAEALAEFERAGAVHWQARVLEFQGLAAEWRGDRGRARERYERSRARYAPVSPGDADRLADRMAALDAPPDRGATAPGPDRPPPDGPGGPPPERAG